MEGLIRLVVFNLDQHRYGLHLSAVDRVITMVEVTPLPDAPEVVMGAVNVQGRVVPVVNVRRRFRLPEREPALSDQLVIARTRRRSVALAVDAVSGLVEHPERDVIAADQIIPGMEYVQGVAKLDDGLVLIHDLDRFLSLDEERTLDAALAGSA